MTVGRDPGPVVAPDPYCGLCGTWHLRDRHLDLVKIAADGYNRLVRDGLTGDDLNDAWDNLRAALRAEFGRELEKDVRVLPTKGINHTGNYVELAAVLGLLR